MTIKLTIKSVPNEAVVLACIKDYLIKKGLSSVTLKNGKLFIENRLFNGQSRSNCFAYVKKGYISFKVNESGIEIKYYYQNFIFLEYICLVFILLYLFNLLPLIFFILSFSVYGLNTFINHARQKFCLKEAITKALEISK